jgi:NADH-quinone oxidoreductase subunit J
MVQEFFFWVLAVTSVMAALGVVGVQDIFRAALLLVLTFLSVAGLFILLNAEFLAVVQVLIYVGAISVLIIFAVLLTRDVEQGNPSNRLRLPAFVGAGLLFLALTSAIVRTSWTEIPSESLARAEEVFTSTPQWLAGLLLREWALPFEAASVLLLAAVLGAVVLIRERQP